ncbi:MAG: glycine--tRNA ligase subunit beta, partial [Candidatus Gastranaerophilales bacterium]|nr:glycine--tRNA ligase subunit beta [Candidatus Gastranaerophilales bacterium]
HFMRWQYNTEKFSRPIENVVALLDDEIVELEILGKKSTNKTLGHRYSKNLELTIKNPKSYIETLRTGNVIVNQEERRDLIIKLTKECAEKNNLVIKFDNTGDLLEEITYITEYPVPVICEFNEKYLQIPDIVTTTVMISHQRYFPLWNKDGKLSNKFITIANYVGDEFENIKAGNQRVVVARLDDGIFFFEEDTKTKLIDKIDNLKGMTFQKGLGTLYDKTQRIIKLSDKIADKLNIKDKTDILRCAELSKCDLSTKLVFEFTELQGFIGEDYALFDKEKPEVAKGICEHYFPLNANSELPESIIGQVVSIADKIDTVCALFISTQGDKKKKRPTGSNDPLGARRAVIGIIRIILENNLNINLEEIIKTSLDMLSKEFNTSMEDCLLGDIKDFFNSRITFMFEKEISSNVFNSIKSFNSLENLSGYITKAKILNKYQNDENFSIIKENASRVFKILKDNKFEDIKETLFSTNEEKELYKAITMHNASPDNLEEYIISLNALIKPIINFFDNVLVMDKDEKIKNNRIALLNKLRNKFNVVCEFDKL